jgi:hypothetical protein
VSCGVLCGAVCWTPAVMLPPGARHFPLLHMTKTGSVALSERVPGEGVKWPGREAHHSPPTTAEVKKTWISTSTSPSYIFMA